ncbi:MAG: tetratricopeptide repeat protein, partial [Paramuribaculum sp.]|nr:tetratricopeptide repeat protein [Paramuribaculum sp.]
MLRAEVGDNDRAVADLDRVVALTGSRDYRALFNRAMINKNRGRMDDAMADADAIIAAFPDMAAAWFLRSDILQAMGRRKDADNDYQHSLALARKLKSDSQKSDGEGTAAPIAGSGDNDDPFM